MQLNFMTKSDFAAADHTELGLICNNLGQLLKVLELVFLLDDFEQSHLKGCINRARWCALVSGLHSYCRDSTPCA